MEHLPKYDVAIVGGGLAGLAAAILLRRQGYQVVVFEKEAYPYHKVCGEYISLESWNFLLLLGLPLSEWQLPKIDTLQLSAPNGKVFTTKLPLGGFGISRYKLDAALAQIAIQNGVHLLQKTKVDNIEKKGEFILQFNQQSITATLCFAAYGKRSNLDVRWNRSFLHQHDKRLNNYVGVKYHIKTAWPPNVIGLHNFENGYCGISKIEEDQYCLCYMTRAENLKKNNQSVRTMEEAVLFKNLHIKNIFQTSDILSGFPVTISQISFAPKARVEKGVLMLGDTAGMITPLCGNGMSIALHTAKIAASVGDVFLQDKITRSALETAYARQWQQEFAFRLRAGRVLQKFFGSNRLSNTFVQTFRKFPFLAAPVIRLTHGDSF